MHALCNTIRSSASFSQAGDRAVAHVAMAPRTGRPVVGLAGSVRSETTGRRGGDEGHNRRGIVHG